MHFIGIKWNNQSEQPTMNVIDKKSTFSLRDPLTIKVLDQRTCVGHYSHPEYNMVRCPHGSTVSEGSQCSKCNQQDSKYFLHLNALSNDQLNVLEKQPHTNYIDVFGDNKLKTGVAASVRQNTRLLEQGASAGMFFSESDGVVARKIEQAISRALNIAQSVNTQTKIKLIKIEISEEEALKILKKTYIEICKIIPQEYKKYLKNEPEFTFKIDKYKKKIPANLKSITYVNKISALDVISGEIIGILGDLILIHSLDNSKKVYAVSSRALGGYHIQIENVRD